MAKKKIIFLLTRWGAVVFSLFILFGAHSAAAEKMILGPIAIDLPTGWKCQTEELNYICLDQSANSLKNSAVIITYKQRTPEDTLVVFRDQLARPRELLRGDIVTPSEPRGVTERRIHGVTWIEGIHYGSEVPNYYTHYYASVDDTYAYLVSFSIEKSVYTETLSRFQEVIGSVKIIPNAPGSTNDANTVAGNTTPAPLEPTPAPNSPSAKVGRVELLGYSFPRMYLAMGLGLLAVLGLLGYALISE